MKAMKVPVNMDILYVNPASLKSGLDPISESPPLNLMTIAAMVPEHGARLFDFKVEEYDENRFSAELNQADVVAITSLTPQIHAALDVARLAKEQGCTTIVGGYHATLDPGFVMNDPSVDYAVRGEGEHTFHELIDYIDGKTQGTRLEDIDGLSFRHNDGTIAHNKPRALECDLDSFPLPRRDIIAGKEYRFMGARSDVIETSRGCPHDCRFCCIVKMWHDPGQKIRYRTKSLHRIVQELESLDKKKEFVFFADDNFTVNPNRVKTILEGITASKRTHKMNYGAQSRVDVLHDNPWLVKLMRKAKFRQIFLGIESLHQQSLDAMNKKHTTPAKARHVVQMLSSEGISVFGGMIIGFPGETREMVYQNIQYAKSLQLSMIQFTPITAFPGTDFHEEMEARGMITSTDYRDYDLFHAMMRTEQLSTEDLNGLMKEAYAAYYLDGDYIKHEAKKFLNPFGKWGWLFKKLPGVIKQFLLGGATMLKEQGIMRDVISEELKGTTLPDFTDNQEKSELDVDAMPREHRVAPPVFLEQQ
ncbi:MAG TPA: radical SAM protein [Candidatus Lokiarchaeia archaeon]|nr:radical SAM protein [Candidatus Lokiarchaeia archaeon]